MKETYNQWTETAIDCYKRHCICSGCLLKEVLGDKCRMKQVVIQLVRDLGLPKEKKFFIPGITPSEEKVVDAILSGCETKKDIAIKIGTSEFMVQNYLCDLYKLVEVQGYSFVKSKYKLPELIEIIKEIDYDTREQT